MHQLLIQHFDESQKSDNYNGMMKLWVDETHPDISKVIARYCPTGYKYTRGNFFQHDQPYYPHVDGYEDEINVLLPLRMHIGPQKFIVFDQTFPRPATWSLNPKLGEFKVNKLHRCCPADDYEVRGLTGLPCPFAEELPGAASFWHGLSGAVYDWYPGAVITFPSNRIHATGRQQGPKLGLTLIYKRT